MFNFTEQQFIDETKRLIEESPDFCYPGPKCRYVANEEKPACLFGQVILNLDSDAKAVLNTADLGIDSDYDHNPEIEHLLIANTEFSYATKVWAVNIQRRQDEGLPWKECLEVRSEL